LENTKATFTLWIIIPIALVCDLDQPRAVFVAILI